MRQRVSNTGDPAKDWEDRGPCQPMPLGPSGERHSSRAREGRMMMDDESRPHAMVFPRPGVRPTQLPLNVSIEASYDD